MLSSQMWTPEVRRYPWLHSDKQVLNAIVSLMRQLAQNFSSSKLRRPKCGSGHDIGARYVTAFIFLTSLLSYNLLFIFDDWILGFVLYLITTYYSTPCKCKCCLMLNFWKFIHCIHSRADL